MKPRVTSSLQMSSNFGRASTSDLLQCTTLFSSADGQYSPTWALDRFGSQLIRCTRTVKIPGGPNFWWSEIFTLISRRQIMAASFGGGRLQQICNFPYSLQFSCLCMPKKLGLVICLCFWQTFSVPIWSSRYVWTINCALAHSLKRTGTFSLTYSRSHSSK